MLFPYEHYETLAEPLTVYYPTGEEQRARWVFQTVDTASGLLSQLLGQSMPEMEILLLDTADWSIAPRNEDETLGTPQPYWTDAVSPPLLVIPAEIDPIFGELTEEKFAFFLYHELTLAYLESDPRPWPDDYPLWADEWQLKLAALWLFQRRYSKQGIVNEDLRTLHSEIFEPEPDGKTPVTIRGFDWYEDTASEDYLDYELLLEQFAADILARYGPEVLPRFLESYRVERAELLSEDVTSMLAQALGSGGDAWLESLVYF